MTEIPSNNFCIELLANPMLRALLDVVREAILIVDLDMQVLFVNRTARELFNFPSNNYHNLRLTDITRNRDIYQCFTNALREKHLFERRAQLHHTSAGERILDIRVESIAQQTSDGQEVIVGAVGAILDTTKLELLEQIRREFFANLSHELRTPLTSILSYVETLLAGALHDQENNIKFLKIIAKHAERMRNLAQDISDLAAIESGKVSLKLQPLRVSQVVREVSELLKDALNSRQIQFTAEISEEYLVLADPKGLEQILFNLIQNAINFNRKGGSISVTAQLENSYLLIFVRDTGIGIEAKHLHRIFERLYRVDESRSKKEGGTGLGLAIVKHLVQSQNGSISVESVPNQGTTFILRLPLALD